MSCSGARSRGACRLPAAGISSSPNDHRGSLKGFHVFHVVFVYKGLAFVSTTPTDEDEDSVTRLEVVTEQSTREEGEMEQVTTEEYPRPSAPNNLSLLQEPDRPFQANLATLATLFEGPVHRRPRYSRWTNQEYVSFCEGYRRYGQRWRLYLRDPELHFSPDRDSESLRQFFRRLRRQWRALSQSTQPSLAS